MEFNLSTFLLEIINFLVLIWILQRFLYKPVLEVIDRRKQSVDKVLADAQRQRDEAEALQEKYVNRLAHWQQEKKQALETLHQEIERERARQMAALKKQLEEERKKAQIIARRQVQDFQAQAEKRALLQGARFASLLLQRAAGPELENSLFDLLLEELSALPEQRRQFLQMQQDPVARIQVCSVYPLQQMQRQKLDQVLNALLGRAVEYEYRQDPALITGFRLSIGSWLLQANIKHELAGFVDLGNAGE